MRKSRDLDNLKNIDTLLDVTLDSTQKENLAKSIEMMSKSDRGVDFEKYIAQTEDNEKFYPMMLVPQD